MKVRTSRILFLAILLSVAPLALQAQGWRGWRGSGGWGPGTRYVGMYNPGNVRTISGVIISVERFVPVRGMSAGIHVVVRTGSETLPVHLGPEFYIERLDTRIERGDTIEVKGSLVTLDGKDIIIAAEVRKGGEVLVLRDAKGFPAWAGWRR
jgi:hypothetical protein